ncbi:MAG: ATP-binding protein [Candidatus Delongbacteria bacterium]|nr:ATP-binding protein [Candidatus Delongbacteria bacterium]
MKRYFESYLVDWKNRKSRKPLIVRGARQIGKTYTIDEFGKKHFSDVIKINFEEKPEFKSFFKTNDTEDIIMNISAYFGKKIVNGETLLFIDEIQQYPEAIVGLRYFYENMPGLHVIAAGSLLDHVLNDIKYSMPVGRVEFAYMYPLNFFEFLTAMDEESLVDYLNNYKLGMKISVPIHEKLLKLVRLYYFIGGMPEAVSEYSETKDIISVERIHESILRSLEFDFSKYGTKTQQEILVTILRYIPSSLARKIKYVNIDPDKRSDAIKTALKLLQMSRIAHLVTNTSSGGVPLEQGKNDKIIKPLFLDIGLANHILKLRLVDINDLITISEGSLAEQFVGQQLLTTEPFFLDTQLYYWTREAKNSNAELDFVTEFANKIIPIEVKAGKSGTLRSLQIYMKEKKLRTALRFNTDQPSKITTDYDLISLPLYLAPLYKNFVE